MGLSKLSEKCQKCDRKDTCEEKRMEACAYIMPYATGRIISHEASFYSHPNNNIEIVGNIQRRNPDFQAITEAIAKSVRENINECAFKIGG